IRADDLAALPIKALIDRNPKVDWAELDDVILGCANQAGEDNRNLARMAGLLAGLPDSSGGVTLNRLCGSGLDAVAMAARASRGDQDAFALRSQEKTAAAQANGRLAAEIVAVEIPQRKGDPVVVDQDEHPRLTSLDKLAALKPIVRKDGSVTAGNASGVNDGA